MELTYQGRYFDGQSSKPHTVNIAWIKDGLLIQYTNNGEVINTKWLSSHITHIQVSNGIVSLKYGDTFPYQQLDVTDTEFIQRYRVEYLRKPAKKIRFIGLYTLLTLIAVIGALIWLTYFLLLPLVADLGAKVFPKNYEISMGKKLYETVLSEEKIDSNKTIAINQFFKQLHVETAYPIQITVVKNNIVNAFAMPGGGIVVYDEILKGMNSPEQLAALLSHEFSHVELRHTTKNLFRTMAGYLFISIIFNDANGIAAILVENAHELRNLSYNRELETEADNNGLKILQQNNLNAQGMIDLFEQLKGVSTIEVNELISTHPDVDNRIKNAKVFIKNNPYEIKTNDSLQLYFDVLKN
jgi:predicted Zn-dependent protease